ncbi:hypothetical protein GIX45_00050 [Erwinia sp. CPCC 100877]|nr:hypothetical protein [Erwinia sp. CPCC 100877]
MRFRTTSDGSASSRFLRMGKSGIVIFSDEKGLAGVTMGDERAEKITQKVADVPYAEEDDFGAC